MKINAVFLSKSCYLIAVDVMPILHRDRQSGVTTQIASLALASLFQKGHIIGRVRSYGLTADDAARRAAAGVISSLTTDAGIAKRHPLTKTWPQRMPTMPEQGACLRKSANTSQASESRARHRRAQHSLQLKPVGSNTASSLSTVREHHRALWEQSTFAKQPDEIQYLIRTAVQTMYFDGNARKTDLTEWLRAAILNLNQSRSAELTLKVPSAKTLCRWIDEYIDLSLRRGLAVEGDKRADATSAEASDKTDKI